MDLLALAAHNLGTPMVLSFALGFLAALARSDLSVPEAAAKLLSIYLLFAIGFKGGVAVNESGLTLGIALALLAGIGLSALIPLVAFGILRAISRLDPIDAAAVSAHYGSISIVTFVAASAALMSQEVPAEGHLVAVAAAMEAPAILTALWLARRARPSAPDAEEGQLMREILLNGSIVLLVGAFAIGWITGPTGRADIAPLIDAPFKGILCLFLLDMGLVAGRGMRQSAHLLGPSLIGFGLVMPLIGAAMALPVALLLGLSPGGAAILLTLAASASYIAVPAAMRVALPEANPSIYLTLSLGITFPFNLTLGIPIYLGIAAMFAG
jgi:uncharacterized protein